jgi:DNA-binding transcriptional regulator GbsR (MarR family)
VPGCAALRKKGDKTKEQTFHSKNDLTNHLMSLVYHKTVEEIQAALALFQNAAAEKHKDEELRRKAVNLIKEFFFRSGMQ